MAPHRGLFVASAVTLASIVLPDTHAFPLLVNGGNAVRRRASGIYMQQTRRRPASTAGTTSATAAPPPSSTSAGPKTVSEMSKQMREMRQDMMQNEETRLYMEALRGSGIRDYDAASISMSLIGEGDSDEDGADVSGAFGSDATADGSAAGSVGDRLPLEYDPEALARYFAKRPQVVTRRLLQLASAFSGFVGSLAMDRLRGKGAENEVLRAGQLRDIITSLGPFYIKLGQALSIRPDILSPRAMVELQRLCDKVPSYDSVTAFKIMERELGRPVSETFSEISPEPLAAASLGQVYKATLRSTGDIVAVKVQRPGVLETVSLDLHLVRQLGYQMRKIPFLAERADLVALLDEFASRFFDELNYQKECENGIRIKQDMAHIKQIVVPRNYPEWTSRRVFVSEWLEGEKLSQSTADDVQELINVGVVAYLTQLLDTGYLHADPHPGNLIRTPEGKLALLDFGLMTQITDDQKYGMIEAISHLVHRDYLSIGEDFKRLDFLPADVDVAPVIPALSNVFDAALAGGGAKSINFQALAADLAQITFDYPFRIPPYFALVIRAIGVLEGIALVGNPDFAIVDEAYPYISKRLLTDESPRLRAALRYMIYGKGNVFDVERLIDMLQAFETFAAVRDDKAGNVRTAAAAGATASAGAVAGGGAAALGAAAGASVAARGPATALAGVAGMVAAAPATSAAGTGVAAVAAVGAPMTAAAASAATRRAAAVAAGRLPATPIGGGGSGIPATAAAAGRLATTTAATTGLPFTPPIPTAAAAPAVAMVAAGGSGGGPGDAGKAREALRFLFSPEGAFFREFLLDEVVKGVDCLSRDAARELAYTVGLRGPWVPSLLRAIAPPLSAEDQKVLENTRKLLAFLLGDINNAQVTLTRPTPVNPRLGLFGLNVAAPPFDVLGLPGRAGGGGGSSSAAGAVAASRLLREELAPVVAELGPQMREFGLQIVGRLTEKLASRVLRYTSDRVLGNFYRDGDGAITGANAGGGGSRSIPFEAATARQ